MASRTGILSDAHSDKFCLEFNAAPLGYFQATYNELPMNPNLPGIKTPRYVQTVDKPVSLDVAAVNLGKLLHRNSHASSSFVLDRMVDNVQDFSPPKVTIVPPQGTNTPVASIVPNLTRPSRSTQVATEVSGAASTPPLQTQMVTQEQQTLPRTPRTPFGMISEAAGTAAGTAAQMLRSARAVRRQQRRMPGSTSPHTGEVGAPNTAQRNRQELLTDARATQLFAEMDADESRQQYEQRAAAEPQRRQRLTADQRAMQEAQTFMATSHY